MDFFKALEKAAEEWEIDPLLTVPLSITAFPQKTEPRLLDQKNCTVNFLSPSISKPSKPPKWTLEDDQLLKSIVPRLKPDWSAIAAYFPGRPKSMVRRRWENRFDPDIKKSPWSEEEDLMIITLLEKLGPVWKEISARMEGRPPDVIKNRYYGHIRRQEGPAMLPSTLSTEQEKPATDTDSEWERLISIPQDTSDTVKSEKSAKIEELRQEIERLEMQWRLAKDKLREMEGSANE